MAASRGDVTPAAPSHSSPSKTPASASVFGIPSASMTATTGSTARVALSMLSEAFPTPTITVPSWATR